MSITGAAVPANLSNSLVLHLGNMDRRHLMICKWKNTPPVFSHQIPVTPWIDPPKEGDEQYVDPADITVRHPTILHVPHQGALMARVHDTFGDHIPVTPTRSASPPLA